MQKIIPIIDLFAGPGGLGEGFSTSIKDAKYNFEIKLSIEKDPVSCETLLMRSFLRKFKFNKIPKEYYKFIKEQDKSKKDEIKNQLFRDYNKQYIDARNEVVNAELGSEKFPPSFFDMKIKKALNEEKNWLLIGGPPCQAYSLVGRSRVGGIRGNDHRVYLYKEYLRIIAMHQPTIFVMENVKGLLSSKVKDQNVFELMLNDLTNPSKVFKDISSKRYNIYSLSNFPKKINKDGIPSYKSLNDYLIKAENYRIPQKRHRVILIGIRNDHKVLPEILQKHKEKINLKSIIGDLPKIRSGIHRKIAKSSKNKKKYEIIRNTNENWLMIIKNYQEELLLSLSFFKRKFRPVQNKNGLGNEYIRYKTPSLFNPLFDWYNDKNLVGVIHHKSRSHLNTDLKRYMFSTIYAKHHNRFPRLKDYYKYDRNLIPNHKNASSGKFADRFRVQLPLEVATTITSHISKDGHYFIHYDEKQCRSLTVREAARIQTFPDNYFFSGPRTAQFHQVGNAVPPLLANQIAKIVSNLFNDIINH